MQKFIVGKRRLQIERLESRHLLATVPLGSVAGDVFVDNNESGTIDSGEGVANASVELYADTNDNGSFDDVGDNLIENATTDVNGGFAFEGLVAGNYFVIQPEQVVNGNSLDRQVSAVLAVTDEGALVEVIDLFSLESGPTADENPPGTPVTDVFSAPNVLGDNREFVADFKSGPVGQQVSIRTETGDLLIDSDIQSTGTLTVRWDGGGVGLNPTGLGGVDVTDVNGMAAGRLVRLRNVIFDHGGATITVRAYTDANRFSVATISVPDSAIEDFDIPLSGVANGLQFQPQGASGGVDFTNLGAIEMEIDTTQDATDGGIAQVRVLGPSATPFSFLNQPPAPQIDVEKLTNGAQADNPNDSDVPFVNVGSTVTWTYLVTNTGTVDITNVELTDDRLGPITTISQQGDGDSVLAPDEQWVFEASGLAIEGSYTNTATVVGRTVGGQSATDSDASNYNGGSASIDIEKFTNGAQADSSTDSDVPSIAVGQPVEWTYEVSNTGSVPLTSVQVTDSVVGAVTEVTLRQGGNSDNILEPGELWTYRVAGTAQEGSYENVGTATADSAELSQSVSDSDLSHYFGVTSGIDVEKSTNGIDADTDGSGPNIAVGQTVTFTYVVENLGNTPISNVQVIDDNGTPTDASDDFFATFVSGDSNSNTLLDPTESWNYRATRVATLGAYRNLATVSGRDSMNIDVSDSDPSNHRGVGATSKRSFLASSFR